MDWYVEWCVLLGFRAGTRGIGFPYEYEVYNIVLELIQGGVFCVGAVVLRANNAS